MLAEKDVFPEFDKDNQQLVDRVLIPELINVKTDDRKSGKNYNSSQTNLYENIVESQQDSICRFKQDFTVTFTNKAMRSLLVRDQQDIIGTKLLEMMPQFLSPGFVNFIQLDGENQPEVFRMRFDGPTESELWVEWSKDHIWSEKSDMGEIQIIGRDITYQKSLEDELRLSQERYYNMVDSRSELVICCSPSAVLTFVNRAFCCFFNKSQDEMMGTSFLDLIYEPDREAIRKLLMSMQKEEPEVLFPWRIIKPDGSIGWQEWKSRAIFDESGTMIELQAVGWDISERLEMERALKESEAYYRATFESTGTAMMMYKYDMNIILVNTEFEKLSGYKREEIEHKMKWTHFIDQRDLDMMISYHFQRQVDGRKVPDNYEFRLRDRWDNIKNVFLTVAVIHENQAVVVSFMDITERKKMEQALIQSERRYLSILNACPNELSISTIDEGRFIDVNQQMCKTMGRSHNEIIGYTSLELGIWVNPEDRAELVAMLKENGSVRNREYTLRSKTGREIIALVSAEIYEVEGKQCMILISNDISEKKQMERELARLDQLNLVGEMAASLGHEVRNPMTSVRGFLQLLKEFESFEFYSEYFNIMIEELDSANQIITEFLSMARHKNVDLELRNLNSIVMSVAPLVKADAVAQDKWLELQLNEVVEIMLDEKEIRQLICNLSRNGLESMDAGKKLLIKTYLKENKIILSIKDEGNGIPREVIDKIGVPFFTTKEKGTGLGLPVCYSIAARHKASIQLETSQAGTTFFVSFDLPDSEYC